MYSSTSEFIDFYIDDKLNNFNTKLMDEYIDNNFNCKYYDDENIDLKYAECCLCTEDCQCTNYWDDYFMRNKILMFPKNNYFQKYYEDTFPKRIFHDKIFYYLPNDCKTIAIKYVDENIIDTYDISRTITYYFINNSIALIQDRMDGWFGQMFKHYHTNESEKINNYMEILNNYNVHSDDVRIIKY
jgi:hypothetical protein